MSNRHVMKMLYISWEIRTPSTSSPRQTDPGGNFNISTLGMESVNLEDYYLA